ncbi:phage holin family protein [Nocardia bhagyanarayanae]|uniref:Putative membrane protein n=1 Tax=Nocardia bhagyanarayanae TaxID=1215925 RepID=A0A543F8V9_9NOCA|nr:phage holin family protein [Nocardia bhagyanarayanae]TQM30277.1 putative membrane protein [Nocardia bhagyanarayanae]
MQLVLRLIINAVAIWLAAAWVSGIAIISPDDNGTAGKVVVALIIAIIFTVVNALVKPLVKLLSLPLIMLTLGLFLLLINALMLWLTAEITELAETTDFGLQVNGFWAAVLGGIIISLVNWVLGVLVPDND